MGSTFSSNHYIAMSIDKTFDPSEIVNIFKNILISNIHCCFRIRESLLPFELTIIK